GDDVSFGSGCTVAFMPTRSTDRSTTTSSAYVPGQTTTRSPGAACAIPSLIVVYVGPPPQLADPGGLTYTVPTAADATPASASVHAATATALAMSRLTRHPPSCLPAGPPVRAGGGRSLLRVVLLLDRAGAVDVDAEPDPARERLEERGRLAPVHELRQPRDTDCGSVDDVSGLEQDADRSRRRDRVQVRPPRLVHDVVVVRHRLAFRDRAVLGGGLVRRRAAEEVRRIEAQRVRVAPPVE